MIRKKIALLCLLSSLFGIHFTHSMDTSFQTDHSTRSSFSLYCEEHPVTSIKNLKDFLSTTTSQTYEKNQKILQKVLGLTKKFLYAKDPIIIQELCDLVCELLQKFPYHYAPTLELIIQELELCMHIPQKERNDIVFAFADFKSRHLEQYKQRIEADSASSECTLV